MSRGATFAFSSAALQILQGGCRCRDDVSLHFQPEAEHTDWIRDSFLSINNEVARNDMQNLPVAGHRHGPRRLDRPADILVRDFVVGV